MTSTWSAPSSRDPLPPRSSRRSKRADGRITRRRLAFEAIEDRVLPATITWNNAAGGAWGTASNWAGGVVPGVNDDVVIPDLGVAGPNLTITYSTGTTTVKSISSAENVVVSGGTLTTTLGSSGAGGLAIQGGTYQFGGTGWTNTLATTLTSGALNLGGSFTQAGLGSLTRTGGTVYLKGTLTGGLTLDAITGPWYLQAGTILGGTVTTDAVNTLKATATATGGGGTLDGVTVAAGSVIDAAEQDRATLRLRNGLTLDGTLLVGRTDGTGNGYATVTLQGTQTVGGTGSLVFGANFSNAVTSDTTEYTVTFGPGLTITGKNGSFAGAGGVTYFNFQGPVRADGAGAIIRLGESPNNNINYVNALATSGAIDAVNGGAIVIAANGTWTNTGTITAGAGSRLTVDTGAWTNTGTIAATGATLSLGGAFTQYGLGSATPAPGQGTFTRSGGTVYLRGTLTGGLTLDANTGVWYLYGGTIVGGTVTTDAVNTLKITYGPNGGGGTFDGVTVAAGSVIDAAEQDLPALRLRNGLTLNGTLLVGRTNGSGSGSATVTLQGTQTVGGTGSLVFGANASNTVDTDASGYTVTFGPGLTITGKNGSIIGHTVGVSVTNFNFQGPVRADGAGAIIRLGQALNGSSFTNAIVTSGAIDAVNGGAINIAAGGVLGTWSNTGTISVTGPGSTLTVASGIWTNTGTIAMTGGVLSLGGSFTQYGLGSATPAPGQGTFTRSGGTVYLKGTLTGGLTLDAITGTWYLQGGTILGGTVTTDAVNTLKATTGGGTLDGVTVAAGSVIDAAEQVTAGLGLRNGLTLDGTLLVGRADGSAYGYVTLQGTQTVGGTGSIVFGAHASNTLATNASGYTVTFGPGLTITGKNGSIIGHTVGVSVTNFNFQGPVRADGAGAIIRLGQTSFGDGAVNALVTSGAIDAVNGGAITVATSVVPGTWTNTGTITVGAGSTLTVAAISWTNTGTIAATNATVNLGGSFNSTSVATFSRAGGTVNLTGVISGDLTLNDTLGSWNFVGGTFRNGTYRVAPGSSARLVATTTNSFLDNVTLASPIELITNNASVTALNGLTINTSQPMGANTLVSNTFFYFQGNQTVRTDGGGEFVFSTALGNAVRQRNTGDVLTIAPGVTVRGLYGKVGSNIGTLINQGSILAQGGSSQNFNVELGNASRNEGTITGTNGAWLRVYGTSNASWVNFGAISTAAGGILQIGIQTNETWANVGTISAVGSTVNLSGGGAAVGKPMRQASLGSLTRDAASTVNLTGLFTLTGDLNLDDTTGSWVLAGATIQNGTIRTSGAARLVGTTSSTGGTLSNVTLLGDLDLRSTFATVDITNGLTLNTTLQIGDPSGSNYGFLRFVGNQTLAGTGTIVFGAHTSNIIQGVTTALVLGDGITVQGKNGLFGSGLTSLENRGTIAADVAGGVIDVSANAFRNLGTVRARSGGTLAIHTAAVAGLANLTVTATSGLTSSAVLTGGTWEAGAGSTLRLYLTGSSPNEQPIQIVRNDANIVLDGGLSKFLTTRYLQTDALVALTEVGGEGSLTISGGRQFAVPADFANAGRVVVGAGSTFGSLATPSPTSSGLVGLWKGEGNANDSSPTGNNGAAVGAVAYGTGALDMGFNFDGSSHVSVPSASSLDLAGSLSISLWVNLNANNFNNGMVYKGTFSGNQGVYSLGFGTGNSNKLTFRLNGSTSEGIGQATSATTLTPGTWYHVAAVYNKTTGTQKIYINGVEDISKSYTNAIATVAGPLILGGFYSTGFQLNGRLDEVGIYNRALSAAEVLTTAQYQPGTRLVQSAGATIVNGTLIVPGNMTLSGGVLGGSGTVQGSVTNTAGTVAPGNSPGFLDITGNYTQTAAGTLDLELAGRDPNVPQFDRLRVTGTATLGGTVRVTLLDDFLPTPGDAFSVLTSSGRVGQFANQEFPSPGGSGRRIASLYDSNNLTLQVQNVPPVAFTYVTTQGTPVVGQSAIPSDVVTDAAGNSYTIGRFNGTVDFDLEHVTPGDTLTANSDYDGYLAKYDPNGALLWVRLIDSLSAEFSQASALVIDDRGNTNPVDDWVYATGPFTVEVSYNGGPAVNTASTSSFLLKVDASGNQLGLEGLVLSTTSIALAPSGDVLVAGHFSFTQDFDPDPIDSFILVSAGFPDAFVAEYSPSFDFVRAAQLGSVTTDTATGVAVDGSGMVWVVGNFSGTTTGQAVLSLPGGQSDIFVLKLQPNLTGFSTLLAQAYGGPGGDTPIGVKLDAQGNPVIAGRFAFQMDLDLAPNRDFVLVSSGGDDIFVMKLDANGGFRWGRSIGGYQNDWVRDLALDAQGNVYTTGLFRDRVDFDPGDSSYILDAADPSNPTRYESFLSKLDANGRFAWAASFVAEGTSDGKAIDVDLLGNVTSVGNSSGTVDFDPTDGVATRTGLIAYLSRLRQLLAPSPTILGLPIDAADPSLVEGASFAFSALVVDPDSTYHTYSWSLTKDGEAYSAGSGRTFSLTFEDQGVYQLSLVVTDESGNRGTASATLRVRNAPPALLPASYNAGLATANPGAAPTAGDRFGTSIAVGLSSGGQEIVLVGAPLDDANGTDSGAAHLYKNGTLAFTFAASPAGAKFGSSVAIVAEYAVVGAPEDGPGRVYVYRIDTGALVSAFSLLTGLGGDRFGAALGSFGRFVVVGAPGRTTAAGGSVGEAYLYDPATGTLRQTFANPSPSAGDEFGVAVVVVGAGVLIGAPGDDSAGLDAGAAYFADPGNGRVLATLLNPNGAFPGSRFGSVLATGDLNRAFIGAPLDDSAGTDAGGVYLFDLKTGSATFGTFLRVLRSPNASPNNSRFGSSIATIGRRALIGAENDGLTVAGSGTAYLVNADPSLASFGAAVASLKKPTPVATERFGARVAVVGDILIVAAPDDDTGGVDAGSIHRFSPANFFGLSTTSIPENSVLTVTGALADPGSSDTHAIVLDWGDGSPLTRIPLGAGVWEFSAQHVYLDDNPTGTASDPATIRLRVQDDTPDLIALDSATSLATRFEGTTDTALGTFLNAGAAGVSSPSAMTLGPDGNLYLSGGAAGTNAVVRFDGITGAPLFTFIPAGTAGTDKAGGLTFGPDGNLYYAHTSGNRILKFHGITGAFLGEFVTAASGGLSAPRGLIFGPDGSLLVASAGNGKVLRFDGASGAFLGTFLDSASAGLTSPDALLIAPDGFLYVADRAGLSSFVLRFDPVTGEPLGTLAELTATSSPIHLAAGAGQTLDVSLGGGSVYRYDLDTGELRIRITMPAGSPLASLPLQDEGSRSLTITNVAPTVNVTALRNTTAGQYTLGAVVKDPGTLDTFTYAWTVSGATVVGATTGSSITFNAANSSTTTVTLTVTDDDTGSVTATTRVITGTPGNDTITVTNPGGVFTKVIVFALAGNDSVSASAVTIPVELLGGAGDDTLTGGSKDDLLLGNSPGDYTLAFDDPANDRGADSLTGGAGNDTLDGGLGDDTMIGGAGNDTYIQVPGSSDLLREDGASGIDTIDYTFSYFGISFSLNKTSVAQVVNPAAAFANQHTVTILGSFENLTGSSFADSLSGNALDNLLNGGAGDDQLFGGDTLDSVAGILGDGQDTLIGGFGNDTISGGSGNDVIFGGDALDSVAGGLGGDDSLIGGYGNDTIYGGSGNDVIFGGNALDTISGGLGGDNLLIGGYGNDTIQGGSGNDVIFGGDSLDTVQGTLGGPRDGNNLLIGGFGNDTIYGGSGNDVIFGGDALDSVAGGLGGDDSLIGGFGNDTIYGGSGNDVIFGGDQLDSVAGGLGGDDSLIGGFGNDTIYGGSGNDIIFGGDRLDTAVGGLGGDDSLIGGFGNDTISGGSGNDIIFGGDQLDSVVGALGGGDDSLFGGSGNDTIYGGAGNDVIFGGEGDDILSGNDGDTIYEGGSGIDRIVEVFDADMTLGPTTLTIGTRVHRHYDIEQAGLGGGPGNNRLDASTFPGSVILVGFAGNDTLIGGAFGDILSGGSGNDSLVGNDGDDTIDPGEGDDFADGGLGNDTYQQKPGSADVFSDAYGIDTIDFSTADFGIRLDLALGATQTVDTAGNTLRLVGTFENLRGSSLDDDLKGNAAPNIIEGGGGQDRIDGRDGNDVLQGSFPQIVYLDFDSATVKGQKVYSIEDRNRIQAILVQDFAAPYSLIFTQTSPSVGRFSTIVINAGVRGLNEALVAGIAYELDWRNVNAGSRAEVNANGFLGRPGQFAASSDNYVALTSTLVAHELGHLLGLRHSDSFGPIGMNPATGLPYGVFGGLISKSTVRNETRLGQNDPGTGVTTARYPFSKSPVLLGPVSLAGNAQPTPHPAPSGTVFDGVSPVASFVVTAPSGQVVVTTIGAPPRTVLGGQLDTETGVLTLSWSARPSTSSIIVTYDYDAFRPGYRGPDDAVETPNHIMGSPASVGTRIADALGDPSFGERELIKLAFADAGKTAREADLGLITLQVPPLGDRARALGTLPVLAVPNLLPTGAVNAGKSLSVRAISVVGSIAIDPATGRSENDVYAFQGEAGDLVTVEVLSYSIRQRLTGLIDSLVSLHDASGNFLDYYGRPAINDDGFDNQDAILIDVRLPATGTYYVVVDTFAPSVAADTDIGDYELVITSYVDPAGNPSRLAGGGDTVVGGLGEDVIIGSTGDDRLVGETGDLYLNFSDADVVGPNTAPVAVTETYNGFQGTPIVVSQTSLGLLGNDRDAERDPLTALLVTGSGPLHGSLALNLDGTFSYTANPGYFGQDTFSYRAFDGALYSESVIVTINLAPVQTSPIIADDTYQTPEDTPLVVPAPGVLANDPSPGQSVLVQSIPTHGQVQLNPDGSFTYLPAPNYFGIDSFTYIAISGNLASQPATVTITVTPVNDNPLISGVTNNGPASYGNGATVTVVASDLDGPTLNYEFDFDNNGVYEVGPQSGSSASFTFPAVGSYLVGVRVTDGAGGQSTSTTTILVNPRSVTVAADPKSKTVGDSDPALTYQITLGSLVGSDAFQGALARASGENVGTYPITRGTLALGGNYILIYLGASFTITPSGTAPVVTADPASLAVSPGAAVSFTAAASGFPPPTVQWQVSTNGGASFADVAGATSTTYGFVALIGDSGKRFRAVFTNTQGTATSAPATLSVNAVTVAAASLSWGASGASGPLLTQADGLRLLPAGRNISLPWLGIDRVTLSLSAAAPLSAADVSVAGLAVVDYGPVTLAGGGGTYTITFARPIVFADRVTITIGNAGVATYLRELDVLPGDVSDDGVVNSQDQILVRNQILGGAPPSLYYFADVNGDGVVDINDFNDVKKRNGTRLK